MTPTILFYILIGILSLSFLINKALDYLNAQHFEDDIPKELIDVYDTEAYQKSQDYKKINYEFSNIADTFSIVVTLAFFFLNGFRYLDDFVKSISQNSTIVTLLFFGIIMIGSDLLSIPFSYYRTFVIEEQFGFNKTNKRTFFLDKLKGWLMMAILGGIILTLMLLLYELTQTSFWLYSWILIAAFSIFMNMFYAQLIVPLFNKQTPLEEGELKTAIENYAKKVGFALDNIFIIDGSKRSTKANAYFSGFGKQKRITLYDTLLTDLNTDEIVAVLAHEVGHYKKKHIIFNLISAILLTGITLFILSLFINSSILSEALGVGMPSFHIGLIAFGVLYTPISEITSLCMNYISRNFEYQADNYAKETFSEIALISSLKKLSKNSLSNLTPHKFYVFAHYSHPTLLERIKNLKNSIKTC
ncbi:M48 family metallopeptidase [Tenacibaculum maritimum]|uniref:M48 family metallopeptidase n=1 Tax=Tenacibaculum maritimum TaxID=107401 RepID=UPI0012E48ABE|nr:M48 family metallopeptidase [Tenacibaculum maritimum]CAA0231787.1 transmembrane peptidase family M48 [Tenacibaculum maritimum]